MSFLVQVNDAAEEDLISIWHDIAEHNSSAADKFVRRLGARINDLNTMPERGAPRDDLITGVRMLVEGSYLIFYRLHANKVEVLRIIHGSRDLTSLFS
jgi:toxin ParE1/3/4